MSCIPNNTEKYISVYLGQLRFIDSAQFLLASLDKLVAANRTEAFQITAQYELNEARCKLIMRKGVCPYEYMDSWVRFEEIKLPPKEAFTASYLMRPSTRRITTFRCKTLGDYSDLYCHTDVLLLIDVFETFRKTCLRQFGLEPAHYYTSPGLSWDTLLKKSGARAGHRL